MIIFVSAGPSNRFENLPQEGCSTSNTLAKNDVSPRMVLKRVMKSSPPSYLASKMKKSRTEQNASESLAVALKSLPHSMPRFDQPDHSATPVGSSHRHPMTISTAARGASNGHHSSSSTAAASHGEVPKLMIKLKPVLPKVTPHTGFPFIFANSDSDNSEPVSKHFTFNYFFKSFKLIIFVCFVNYFKDSE